jgi:putative ABC transport system permease protein
MMLLLGFGQGLKKQMSTAQDGLGGNIVILGAGATARPWEGLKAGRPIRFTEEDVTALRRSLPELDQLAGEYTAWAVDLRWGTNTVSTRVTGVAPCFETIRAHYPQRGSRFLNDEDMARSRRVVFLGPQLKQRLMGSTEAVGQTVFVSGVPFTVIGIMVDKQQNSMYGGPDVDKASIPTSTFEALFGKRDFERILYTVRAPHTTAEMEPRVREVFARRQRFDPTDTGALYFWDTVKNREMTDKITMGMQIFLGMVGAMTLLVAGVGLANMLFVMVQRRTREIGMQMAIGAQRGAVVSQVVGEALILAAIGGYLGIGLSWVLVEVIQKIPIKSDALRFLGKPTLSIPLGIVTAVVLIGIGCLAGTLPARRAARLNPVEALRHE